MSTEQEKIQQAAENMIDRYGEDALIQVKQRIEELRSRDEPEAHKLWREIAKRVELLLSNPGNKTEH